MDFAGGKRHDVVDIGGEVDYSGIQWFQDAPSRERVSFNSIICITRPSP